MHLKPVFKAVDSLCYIIGNTKKISQDLKGKNCGPPALSFGSNLPKGTPFHLWKQRYQSINSTGPHNHLTAEEKDTPSASCRRVIFAWEELINPRAGAKSPVHMLVKGRIITSMSAIKKKKKKSKNNNYEMDGPKINLKAKRNKQTSHGDTILYSQSRLHHEEGKWNWCIKAASRDRRPEVTGLGHKKVLSSDSGFHPTRILSVELEARQKKRQWRNKIKKYWNGHHDSVGKRGKKKKCAGTEAKNLPH